MIAVVSSGCAHVNQVSAFLLKHKNAGLCVVNTWATGFDDAKIALTAASSVVDPQTEQAVFLIKVEVIGQPTKKRWVVLASDGPRLWLPTAALGGHAMIKNAALKLTQDGIRLEFRNDAPKPTVYRLENDQFAPVVTKK